ncbi:MAG: sigma-70 family RNA polymerase sigma factor [Planctomycetota bacterium]
MIENDKNAATSVTLLGRIQDPEDGSAWNEFVDRYAPQIFSWCLRYRMQDSDAADVTQEVLCKLVEKMRSFRYEPSRGRFRGWLKTVTANTVRDLVASRKRRATVRGEAQDVEWLEFVADERATNELADRIEQAYQSELLQAAEAIVRMRVKPHTWSAYQLAAVEQVPAAEVAKQLEIGVSDVYVSKSRVIKMLREEVLKLDEGA